MQPTRASDRILESVKGQYRTLGFSRNLDDLIAFGVRRRGVDHTHVTRTKTGILVANAGVPGP